MEQLFNFNGFQPICHSAEIFHFFFFFFEISDWYIILKHLRSLTFANTFLKFRSSHYNVVFITSHTERADEK